MGEPVGLLDARKQHDLDFVIGKVREYMPLLIGFMENKENLQDYSRALYDFRARPEHLERQKGCIETINAKLRTLFSEDEIGRMSLGLDKGIVTSIVDHHNILNHPILVSGIIISNLYRLLGEGKRGIFVLSCGGIPFSNNFHKRGFTFAGKVFPFVTAKDRDKTIHFFPKRRLEFLEAAKKNGLLDGLSGAEQDFLRQYEHTINDIGWDKAHDFVDEMTLVNNRIFPLMFEESMRNDVPAMVYFESEYLATEILKELIRAKDSFVYKTLFDASYREQAVREFDGIWGAWDSGKGLGTHFFWLMDGNGEEIALAAARDGMLVPRKGESPGFKLEPGEVLRLLEEKKIYPNLMLNYGTLVFYCGIKPLTGIGSLNYLTDMKSAWLRLLKHRDPREAELVKTIDPSGLISAPIVTYGRNKKGEIAEKYFAELVYSGGLTKEYLKNLACMEVGKLLKTSLISIYDIKVPAPEKKPLELRANDLVGEGFEWIR